MDDPHRMSGPDKWVTGGGGRCEWSQMWAAIFRSFFWEAPKLYQGKQRVDRDPSETDEVGLCSLAVNRVSIEFLIWGACMQVTRLLRNAVPKIATHSSW